MAISQAEGRHPALAARDYNIINGRPAKTSEAMMRDFISAGGRVEWHQLSDDLADATFTHPQGGTIRILWDTARAAKAGLAGKEMWKKYSRQMMRSRCVSEGVRTVCPSATSGFYVPEEVRDMPATALPEAPADTTADLDQFAAITGDPEPPPVFDLFAETQAAAERGMDTLEAFWKPLSPADKSRLKPHLDAYKGIAKIADKTPPDPFGELGLPEVVPVLTEPEEAVVARDVFAELDRDAKAAAEEGSAELSKWWKTLRRGDADLIRHFRPEYERLAKEADAQHGLAL